MNIRFYNGFKIILAGAIFTSELHGSDESGDGSEAKPYKTALKVIFKFNLFSKIISKSYLNKLKRVYECAKMTKSLSMLKTLLRAK